MRYLKKEIPCDWCNAMFRPTKRNKKHSFCSRKCYIKWRVKNQVGITSPNWKGGKTKQGTEYTFILVSKGKYIGEHRLNMEKYLGRKLKADEIVHHKNNDPSDNRINNLEIMSRAEHARHHKPRIGIKGSAGKKSR